MNDQPANADLIARAQHAPGAILHQTTPQAQDSLIQKMMIAASVMAAMKVWASVVACCDASPALEPGEEVFDLVSTAIDRRVVGDGELAAAA